MKNRFLRNLEKKLSVLEDSEKQDIINEYEGIIDEKVKHGKTEEEAIKDFGDFDSLVKEILSAYKVKYNNKNEDEEDFFKQFNDFVKESARIVVDFFEGLSDEFEKRDFKPEDMIELVIKSVVVMVLLLIPFNILKWFLTLIINMILFSPLDNIVVIFINLGISILYLATSALIIIRFAKDIKLTDHKKSSIKPKKEVAKPSKKKEEVVKESHSKLGNFIISVFKVIVILWTVPLIILNVVSYSMLSFLIYLIIKGVYLYGLLLVVGGISLMISHLLSTVYSLLQAKKKISVYPFVVFLIMITVGASLTFDYFVNMKNVNQAPGGYQIKSNYQSLELDDLKSTIYLGKNLSSQDLIVDNNLSDDIVMFEVKHYDYYTSYMLEEIDVVDDYGRPSTRYDIEVSRNTDRVQIINFLIDDLKNQEISKYHDIYDLDIKIYANEKTILKIKD